VGVNRTPASNELTVGFKPIEGLKLGDQVIYGGAAASKFPKKGDVGAVCRVFDPPVEKMEYGSPVRVIDFTLLSVDEDGDILEYGFDSRYFKRKEA
jgi:hypothetical protein